MTTSFVCEKCGKTSPGNSKIWRCECGGLLDIDFKPVFDFSSNPVIGKGMWRYLHALPIENDNTIITLGEGDTPLIPYYHSGVKLLLKMDQLMPTGSFKDRGASLLLSKIHQMGIGIIVEDSSGNAGAAIAAYAARATVKCRIFAPESTSAVKTAQISNYGADLVLIPGDRETTARSAFEAAQKTYYASHSWNPFFLHGVKTIAFELFEQCDMKAPDLIYVPVGNGTLLLGLYIGFRELLDSGFIDRLPRLIAVQSEKFQPLTSAWNGGGDISGKTVSGNTVAEGIAVAEPVRGKQILAAVRRSNGFCMSINDDEVNSALIDLWRDGIYVEPTAAVSVAAALKQSSSIGSDRIEVSILTGHGLKSRPATNKM